MSLIKFLKVNTFTVLLQRSLASSATTKTAIIKDKSKDVTATSHQEPCVIMGMDSKHILCYHPEPEHPFEFTRPIERKIITKDESFLKPDVESIYATRFDTRVATTPQERWMNAQKLSRAFHEHPLIFKRPNRQERIKAFLEKTRPIRKERESI